VRRYRGFISDNDRWNRFTFRSDDVVITTPSKCGTTWMQNIVGMLLLDRVDLGAPISIISPWVDMLTRTEEDVFGRLEGQTHRRFMKTHVPLDGLPRPPGVTFITVIRNPLDAALSMRDHGANIEHQRLVNLRTSVAGEHEDSDSIDVPKDDGDFLRWFIDSQIDGSGSGPDGLRDFCDQVLTYWDARHDPNVHLFHYADLWRDLDGEMRLVTAALDVDPAERRWDDMVEAATLQSMRAAAARTAPEADSGIWQDPAGFFRTGGTRDWESKLEPADIDHFHDRLQDLTGDAADWILRGRSGLDM